MLDTVNGAQAGVRGNARVLDNVAEAVEAIIERVGTTILLGMPIGVGKPTLVANEFYRKAKEDPRITLKILSGLSLVTPGWGSDLERRFMEPLVKRLFDDYPNPTYIADAGKNKLPDNVDLVEFFLTPGGFMNNIPLQRNYISSNFTHVAQHVTDMGLNVAASMVSKMDVDGRPMYSLSSNADAPLDMIYKMHKRQEQGEKCAVIGQVNTNLPFMYGTAAFEQNTMDYVVDSPDYYHTLFGPPREPVSTADFLIGMYSSIVVQDGGTIQIGIGSLGDAIAYGLQQRHTNNAQFQNMLEAIGADSFQEAIDKAGGTGTFEEGLYGCTEMLTDAFIQLLKCGVLKRKVYDDVRIQKPLNEKIITHEVTAKTLDYLLETESIHPRLTKADFDFLQKFGIFKSNIRLEDGYIKNGAGDPIEADLEKKKCRERIIAKCLGSELKEEVLVHSGFFLGPHSFYDALKDMNEEERRRIQMREISYTNQLYGGEELKVAQRAKGRFFNTSVMVTLMGAAVSDGLETGQVISGVGGQYNFVAMGHAMEDARSILMVRSTKERNGELLSNIRWNYGHTTIPRHLKDIYITEYGIAFVRGRTDNDTIKQLLNIADSRFQDELLKKAIESKKVEAGYKIPARFRQNYPERLEKDLQKFRDQGQFATFPFGTELSDVEIMLGKSLRELKEKMSSFSKFQMPRLQQVGKILSVPKEAKPYLERMQLDSPHSSREKVMQKLVLYALTSAGVI